MDVLIILVLSLLAIAGATAIGSRLGVAAPLLLIVFGIAVSLLPFVPEIHVEPEWILAGVLPPLLYSASVSMPSMDFRREFGAIGGLSVLLVVLSSVVLGFFFAWVIPGLGIWWGIALGAIVSPTDAVATSIVKKVGVSPRVVSILEGESLLNDATALVLLRTAIAATAASVSFGGVLGTFAFAVVVAVIIGYLVGKLNLILRARVTDATVNTVISFTVPFLASIPAEALGASGLVAAVVAGLVTGRNAPRMLSAQHRLSESQNWRMIELVLEGAVFLLMGLELTAIIGDVQRDHAGIGFAVVVAAGALLLTILVRSAYVAPLLAGLAARARRGEQMKPKLAQIQEHLDRSPEQRAELGLSRAQGKARGKDRGRAKSTSGLAVGGESTIPAQDRQRGDRPAPSAGRLERFSTRVRRTVADIDYYLAAPLGWREGTIVVWAGMRGAVTLAAAQTLPDDAPSRSLLVLIAFLVAAGSLLLQGGTLKRIVAWVKPSTGSDPDAEAEERAQIIDLLRQAAASAEPAAQPDSKPRALAVIELQRQALLDARDDGLYGAEALNSALAVLDADQISIELRGGPLG
ncbi:sodium:proton antiporter [Leifsonia kafniensis]|uniref:Sodium:proton antiporter n=1 Tax=Leifsonia kafniensis TaxID=475957 RepID=A0ABP7K2Q7_9MICO